MQNKIIQQLEAEQMDRDRVAIGTGRERRVARARDALPLEPALLATGGRVDPRSRGPGVARWWPRCPGGLHLACTLERRLVDDRGRGGFHAWAGIIR